MLGNKIFLLGENASWNKPSTNIQGNYFLSGNATSWRFLTAKNSKYDLSENLPGYDFLIVNLLGRVSVTKIGVHSLIDAERPRRTTLHRTDIYRNLPLGAPDMTLKKQGTINFKYTKLHVDHNINGMKIKVVNLPVSNSDST